MDDTPNTDQTQDDFNEIQQKYAGIWSIKDSDVCALQHRLDDIVMHQFANQLK